MHNFLLEIDAASYDCDTGKINNCIFMIESVEQNI